MSNPAVTKLVYGQFDNMPFWMDDNIGESIHIHLGNFRLDTSILELSVLSNALRDCLTQLINVPGFDCHNFDPVFLSRMLYPLLPHLVSVKVDMVYVGELIVAYDKKGFTRYYNIRKGRVIKALNGKPKENNDTRGSNHLGQTSSERLSAINQSLIDNGYPLNNQYIVVYGDQKLIRDGQHRASCIFNSKGNLEIPILRLYFDDDNLIKYRKSLLIQFFKKLSIKKFFRLLKRKIKTNFKKIKNKLIFIRNRSHYSELKKYFDGF